VNYWSCLRLGRAGGLALTALAGAALLVPGLGAFALLDPNEAKHALIAKHTLEAGRWLEPVLNGVAYHDKPSFFYILVGTCYRVFGVSEASARMVPAVSVWATLLATYLLASKRSVPAGLLAAYVLASSLFFIHLGRFTNLDGAFTATLTLALFSALATMPEPTQRERWRIPYFAFICAGLAVLVKGPVALVLLGAPATAALFAARLDWRRVGRGSALTMLIVAAWAVPVWIEHRDYLVDFVWLHNLERYFGDVAVFHPEPALFFIPIVLAALLPWSTLLPLALARALRLRGPEFYLAIYALALVAFFSLSTGKLATYVVPAFPALAVLVAWWVWAGLDVHGEGGELDGAGRRPALVGAGLLAAVAPLALVAAAIIDTSMLGAAMSFLPASGAAAFVLMRRDRFTTAIDIAGIASAGCVATSLLIGLVGGQAAAKLTSDYDLAAEARALGRPATLVVYRVRPYSFLYYTGWPAVYKVDNEAYVAALESPGETLVLTKEKRLGPLAELAPGLIFETVARNKRHLLLRPIRAQSR